MTKNNRRRQLNNLRELAAQVFLKFYHLKKTTHKAWNDVWPHPFFYSKKILPDVLQPTITSLWQNFGDFIRLKFPDFNLLVVTEPESCRGILLSEKVEKTVDRGITHTIGSYLNPNVLTSEDSISKDYHQHYITIVNQAVKNKAEFAKKIIDLHIENIPTGDVDLVPYFRKIAFHLALWLLFDIKNIDLINDENDYKVMLAFYDAVDLIQQRYLTRKKELDDKILYLKKIVEERLKYWGVNVADKFTMPNQVIILQNAGFETTAATLSWSTYYLSQFPELQISDENILTGVMNEALRLHTPVHIISRTVKEDFILNNHFYKKGDVVLINIAGMQHHQKYWENPTSFDIKRNFNSKAYMPFAIGARGCLGTMQARFVIPNVLSALIKKFQITGLEEKEPSTIESFTVKPSQCRCHLIKK